MTAERSIYFFQPGASEAADAGLLAGGAREAIARLRGLLGGKGAGLHVLAALGLAVPPGFTIAAPRSEEFNRHGGRWPDGLRAELAAAVKRLEEVTGRRLSDPRTPLRVAVRSGAEESMPGMMDTVLDVSTLAGIEAAVEQVFRSFLSERAVAYRRRKGLLGIRGTAVTVQEMCPADAAGVAFTVDPASGAPRVVVEAVSGLGEKLVSGEATPDRAVLSRPDLEVIEERISGGGAILTREELHRIARAGLEVEERLGGPQDIEWALSGGRLYLLQTRAVRLRAEGPSLEGWLMEEAEKLRRFRGPVPAGEDPGRLAFVHHNLGETLSHPTPMTWDIIGEFLGPRGGFFGLYRDLGYRPTRRVEEDGFLALAFGRVYADPLRAAELFFATSRLRHDLDRVRREPDLLNGPPGSWDTRGASPIEAARALYLLVRSIARLGAARRQHPARFVEAILPRYLAWCREKEAQDLARLDGPGLLDELEARIARVHGDFAREALKLSLLAGAALGDLTDFLERRLGVDQGGELARSLVSVLDGDITLEQNRLALSVGRGEARLEEYLEKFGHRAAGEMELGRPRAREDLELLERLRRPAAAQTRERFEARIAERKAEVAREEAGVRERLLRDGREAAVEFDGKLNEARALLPWRETGKHHWMRGHDLIRRVLLEIDRRRFLDGSIFYLTRADLREALEREPATPPATRDRTLDEELGARIRARREEERLARSIEPGDDLTVGDLDLLARGVLPGAETATAAAAASGGPSIRGTPLSAGRAEGPVWNCKDPREACPVASPYILVASTTDTGWTPLLVDAAALVVERGGVLSHGAVVCRDFGVPAVAVQGAAALLSTGDRWRVDGRAGVVERIDGLRLMSAAGAADEPPAPPSEPQAAEYAIPPEPHVRPAKSGLGRRALLSLAAAVAFSLVLVGVAPLRPAVLLAAGAAFDWTIRPGRSPFWSILIASAAAAATATAIGALILDRRQLRQRRERLKWYRLEMGKAKRRPGGDHRSLSAVAILGRRRGQASLERGLDLLRPIGWSFLPFTLAFVWVEERFGEEPVRAGTTFTVAACFRPPAGDSGLRSARLRASASLELLDEPYQKLRPNLASPERGPYRAEWLVSARAAGTASLELSARDENVPMAIHVLAEGESPAGFEKLAQVSGANEITTVEIHRPKVLVHLPAPLLAFVDRAARMVWSERGVTAEAAAIGPVAAFLAMAVLLALLFQRLCGLR